MSVFDAMMMMMMLKSVLLRPTCFSSVMQISVSTSLLLALLNRVLYVFVLFKIAKHYIKNEIVKACLVTL